MLLTFRELMSSGDMTQHLYRMDDVQLRGLQAHVYEQQERLSAFIAAVDHEISLRAKEGTQCHLF